MSLICEVCGASGDNRCYTKCPFYKPLLKWKKAQHAHQGTHCGRYWVERDPDGGHYNRWHAHRIDFDEQLTMDGFETRADAKWFCEKDADEESRKVSPTDKGQDGGRGRGR